MSRSLSFVVVDDFDSILSEGCVAVVIYLEKKTTL